MLSLLHHIYLQGMEVGETIQDLFSSVNISLAVFHQFDRGPQEAQELSNSD